MSVTKALIVVLMTVAVACAVFAEDNSLWIQPYEAGLNSAKAGQWSAAYNSFQKAIEAREMDTDKPTEENITIREQTVIKLWRMGSPYTPHFASGYAAYQAGLHENDPVVRKAWMEKSLTALSWYKHQSLKNPYIHHLAVLVYSELNQPLNVEQTKDDLTKLLSSKQWNRIDKAVLTPADKDLFEDKPIIKKQSVNLVLEPKKDSPKKSELKKEPKPEKIKAVKQEPVKTKSDQPSTSANEAAKSEASAVGQYAKIKQAKSDKKDEIIENKPLDEPKNEPKAVAKPLEEPKALAKKQNSESVAVKDPGTTEKTEAKPKEESKPKTEPKSATEPKQKAEPKPKIQPKPKVVAKPKEKKPEAPPETVVGQYRTLKNDEKSTKKDGVKVEGVLGQYQKVKPSAKTEGTNNRDGLIIETIGSDGVVVRMNAGEPPQTDEKKYALIVGIGKYANSLGELTHAVNDTVAISAALSAYAGYSDANIVTTVNASRKEVLETLQAFAEKLPENAVVLLYVTARGSYNSEDGKDYIFTADAKDKGDYKNAISKNELIGALAEASSRVVSIWQVDRSVSDGGKAFGTDIPSAPGSFVIWNACANGEQCFTASDDSSPTMGLFTRAFVNLLEAKPSSFTNVMDMAIAIAPRVRSAALLFAKKSSQTIITQTPPRPILTNISIEEAGF